MTLRDVIVGLVGIVIGAALSHWLAATRSGAHSAARRKADTLAFLYKLFAQMSAIPPSKNAPPTHTEVIFQKGVPQFREHIAKIKGDYQANPAFDEVINECGLAEEDLCQPTEVLRTLLLVKVQAVANFLEKN